MHDLLKQCNLHELLVSSPGQEGHITLLMSRAKVRLNTKMKKVPLILCIWLKYVGSLLFSLLYIYCALGTQ